MYVQAINKWYCLLFTLLLNKFINLHLSSAQEYSWIVSLTHYYHVMKWQERLASWKWWALVNPSLKCSHLSLQPNEHVSFPRDQCRVPTVRSAVIGREGLLNMRLICFKWAGETHDNNNNKRVQRGGQETKTEMQNERNERISSDHSIKWIS